MGDWIWDILLLGSFYAAVGVGFSLYFGSLRLINLAHGESVTIGAFAALAVRSLLPVNLGILDGLLMLAAAIVACVALGPLVELVAFRRIRDKKPFILLLTSVAISIILREGLAVAWPNGANPHPFPDVLKGFSLPVVNIRATRLFAICLLTVFSVLVAVIVKHTALGRRFRAVSQDPTAAALIGINVDRVMVAAFAIASGLAGVVGYVYGMHYQVIRYDMGLALGLRGFAAAALGGINNIYGGLIGGFLLALLEITSGRLLPGGSIWRDVIVFALLICILAFRPQGILGSYQRESLVSLLRRRDGRVNL